MQEDQVLIEEEDGGYAILLIQEGSRHTMDHQNSLNDAKNYAIYLANRMKLSAYYQNQKLN